MKLILLMLCIWIVSVPARATLGALRCSETHIHLKLREKLGLFTAENRHRLGIGVYAQTSHGDFVLGISPYAGALHQQLVRRMNSNIALNRILWMGELRYDTDGRFPQIVEANETSGYFQEIKQTRASEQPLSHEYENDVRNLPEILLNKYFYGQRFEVAGEARLARELRNVDGNIRHGIGNSIQLMHSLLSALHRPGMSMESQIQILSSIASRQTGDVGLVRWMIHDLLNERRIRMQDVGVALEFLDLVFEPNFSQGHIQSILNKPPRLVSRQLLDLSKFNQGLDELVPFHMWHVIEAQR